MLGVVREIFQSGLLLVTVIALLSCSQPSTDETRQLAARQDLSALADLIEEYRDAHSRLPESLKSMTQVNRTNGQPFLRRIPLDPWGNPYQFNKTENGRFHLVSYGRNGLPGGSGYDSDLKSDDA